MDLLELARRNMGMTYKESVLYRIALEVGYKGRAAEDKAQELMNTYSRKGYNALPFYATSYLRRHCHAKV